MEAKIIMVTLSITCFALGYFIAYVINLRKQNKGNAIRAFVIGNLVRGFSTKIYDSLEKKNYSEIEECVSDMKMFADLNLGLWDITKQFTAAQKKAIEKDITDLNPKKELQLHANGKITVCPVADSKSKN